jgi:glutamate N-acetyltransferase/amino-acid N-acetyltransferase
MDIADLQVSGFRWAGVAAGIKKRGGLDLAAIVADRPVATAALLTTNLVKAAPILVAKKHLRKSSCKTQAVLVNAGCANACTGAQGFGNALASTELLATAIGCESSQVIPASTGVIGALLPIEKIRAAMPALVTALDASHGPLFAQAIMTTDRWPKTARATARIGKSSVTAVCVGKGAGMIHPNVATTLVFVLTDAKCDSEVLHRALKIASRHTLNAVTVDGDTSTNDILLAMASGCAPDARKITDKSQEAALAALFESVLEPVAKSIAKDGEGSEHLVNIEVVGTRNDRDAATIARTIATSPLVKTAFYGKDPNWGRIMAAAGRSGVRFSPEETTITVGDIVIARDGLAVGAVAETAAHEVMLRPEYTVTVSVGAGKGRARYFACDLGHGYIDVNASYRS